MYDELKERCRACSQGCIYPSECSYFDKPPLRCMRQLLSEAADAIEELSRKVEDYETRLELTPEAQYAIDKHADDLIDRMDKLIEGLNEKPRWISVEKALPKEYVSVQAHMTDAGPFPTVREAYLAGGKWFFPALNEYHPVDKWAEFSEPPKEDNDGTR